MANPNTNTRTPNASNPSSLPPRYEICQLDSSHIPWANAILSHSQLFHSTIWPILYPKDITANLHRGFPAAEYLVAHQINSGLSYGVFDTEYEFKRPESRATGGALYWDASEPGILETSGLEAESARLLEQMDFPLVSIALSYDAFDALDMSKMMPLIECLPHFGLMYQLLAMGDTRDPNPSVPTARGQVLYRNATSTRRDYEGQGLMAGMARWLMREADAKGFRAIQIETIASAVEHVWREPPKPYKGSMVTEFNTETWRDEERKKGFGETSQQVCKIYVELKAQE
ncbi:hypothetical protein M011DRAFT_476778 [Sporormia fimetaria CBS 119925]|uniref:N-acetyltransferase domain-containing protein n=1 Tax=Sporormia fimetaria CBS 119925 TaxID=1340428 RepID=A0A6A6VC08_9PLEO|nr:hypothetical protein M011DRAFT_476778 [Sporormia fimetaria CBS 119925]